MLAMARHPGVVELADPAEATDTTGAAGVARAAHHPRRRPHAGGGRSRPAHRGPGAGHGRRDRGRPPRRRPGARSARSRPHRAHRFGPGRAVRLRRGRPGRRSPARRPGARAVGRCRRARLRAAARARRRQRCARNGRRSSLDDRGRRLVDRATAADPALRPSARAFAADAGRAAPVARTGGLRPLRRSAGPTPPGPDPVDVCRDPHPPDAHAGAAHPAAGPDGRSAPHPGSSPARRRRAR